MNYKKLFIVIALSFLQIGISYAQKKLTIEISKSDSPSLVLKVDGGVPIPAEGGELKLAGTSWKLQVVNNNKNKNLQVILRNTVPPNNETTITDTNEHAVDNNVLAGTNFSFAENFSVLIKNGNQEMAPHIIAFSGSPDPSGIQKGGNASGSAIYDAFYLKRGSKPQAKLKILAYYANVEATPAAVQAAYLNNKFLKNELQELAKAGLAQSTLSGLSSMLSSAGGLDVTNIADGLAKFLIKRTKEELNIAFFQNFRDFLNQDKYRDLQTVFPETHRTLDIVGNEIYNYERYIQTLRESFKHDLANLTTNLPSIIDNHPLFFRENPDLAATLLSGVYVAEGLRDKIHPGEILAEFPSTILDSLRPEWKGSIQALQLFSESLRDSAGTNSNYWVTGQELKRTIKDTAVFRIYIGLTYQLAKSKYNGVPFDVLGNISLVKILDKTNAKELHEYQDYVFGFIGKADKLNQMVKTFSKPANDSLALEQYYNYFKSSIDLLEYSTKVGSLPHLESLADLNKRMADYFDIANSTSDLALDINRKNYASAIRNATHIYEVIKVGRSATFVTALEKKSKDLSSLIAATTDATKKADYEKQLAAVNSALPRELESKNVMSKLFTYGSFMASLATASSSDEVAETIEAYALPTGSARIKRETRFNVALNAYLGPNFGVEKIHGVEAGWKGTYGLTTPIGVSISWGHSLFFIPGSEDRWKSGRGGWSSSVFISLIDIGAISSFRFSENDKTTSTDTVTVHQVPKIEWKSLVSPGAFLSIGIPRCPLSINAGFQVGPNLRSISVSPGSSVTTADVSDKMYVRWSISLVVDIPLLNFYTRPRE
ncbi:MAG TPA: hypothetical protein VIU12_17030 [Chryseolinea sp.]